ncbi:MAG: nicotinate phosphoribosyltransferase, partial [Firmicutes bacterium]|nr:nicotinate phosphoribosyltransferase [Bacillota bacterium]
SFGVGTHLITAKDNPSFGGVYKLAAVENKDGSFEPKIKLSENTEKITNPGNKKVYRVYEKDSHKIKADLICFADENFSEEEPLLLFDPMEPWKKTTLQPGEFTLREMLTPLFLNGKCVYGSRPTMEIRDYCLQEQDTLWEESRRLDNPHQVYVDLSQKLYDTKLALLAHGGQL